MKIFTLSRATWLLWHDEGGCIPVVDAQGRLTGILITDRDLWMAWRASRGVGSGRAFGVTMPGAAPGGDDLDLTANDVSTFILGENGVVQPWSPEVPEDRRVDAEDRGVSLGGSLLADPDDLGAFLQHASRVEGYAGRERSESFGDHYRAATIFWNSLSVREREHLVLSARFALGKVESQATWQRAICQLRRVDSELGRRVARGLQHRPGIDASAAGILVPRQGT